MKVKAIKPCFYSGGRDTGEVFEADDRYGNLLVRLGSVVEVQDKKDMHAEESSADKPDKRAYKRKDMQAEGGAK